MLTGQGLTSADSREATGAETPADALGVTKRMSANDAESQESDAPRYRDEQWLREQYIELNRSQADIADECGCGSSTIGRWIRRYDIETRPCSPTPDKRYSDAEWLREQYVKQKKTTVDIAAECECSSMTVRRWLEKHDIETRKGGKKPTDPRLDDADWLREQYIVKHQSLHDIASECGCDHSTVSKWLDRHGIETRSRSQTPDKRLKDADWLREQYIGLERTQADIASECGCGRTTVVDWLNRHGIETRPASPFADARLADADWLREQYVVERRSSYDIATECGCDRTTVNRWLNEHCIDPRSPGLQGENHPRYEGGVAPYGPGWNASKRQRVRERDSHTCQSRGCSMTQSEHLEKYGQKLHVHHLIKARDIDDPEERNSLENLITLCRDCHRRWEKVSEARIRPQIEGVTSD